MNEESENLEIDDNPAIRTRDSPSGSSRPCRSTPIAFLLVGPRGLQALPLFSTSTPVEGELSRTSAYSREGPSGGVSGGSGDVPGGGV